MPYLHIQLSGDADDDLAQRVATQATDLTARLLGKDPALTAVVIDFVPARRWFIAKEALSVSGARSYHWLVTITDETNTKAEKAAYLAAVHETMGGLLGGVADHSYVQVSDVRAAVAVRGGVTQERRYQRPG